MRRAAYACCQFVEAAWQTGACVQADFNSLANDLANQYNDRARMCFAFDEPLSHLIYAGCDMLLVPSMFEPCGLTQMIGMRYGTVAVVRKTGGLADTVFDVDDDSDRAEAYGMEVRPLHSARACGLTALSCMPCCCVLPRAHPSIRAAWRAWRSHL
jgi:glycogen synthase